MSIKKATKSDIVIKNTVLAELAKIGQNQSWLAEQMGISRQTLSSLLKKPSLKTLHRIHAVVNLPDSILALSNDTYVTDIARARVTADKEARDIAADIAEMPEEYRAIVRHLVLDLKRLLRPEAYLSNTDDATKDSYQRSTYDKEVHEKRFTSAKYGDRAWNEGIGGDKGAGEEEGV